MDLKFLDNTPYERIKSLVIIPDKYTVRVKGHRLFILGPAKSGKDTLAVALSKYTQYDGQYYDYTGSTSLTMLPYVYEITKQLLHFEMHGYLLDLEHMSLAEFYEERVNCRIFWYNVIKAFREVDPYFIFTVEDSDLYVGSRDWNELKTVVDTTMESIFVLCTGEDGVDPTWPYTHAQALAMLRNDFGALRGVNVIEFTYRESNWELFLAIQKVAKTVGLMRKKTVTYETRETNFIKYGVRYDGVLKGRF